jgi:hypothetical protein
MDRRAFVAAGVALAARLRHHRSSQPNAVRGAVVIGVDQASGLPKLGAAAKGARDVAEWLRREQFDVTLFDDSQGPVTAAVIFAAVNAFVQRGTLEQLVVYFAGHGFMSGSLSEFWLLSGAPDNPNEAVSLTESAKLAEVTGIPNVVFISDACRSLPGSLGAQRITGSVVFPNPNVAPRTVADVDQFLATRIGAAAYEGKPVSETAAAYKGVFTTCFLEAFQRPDPDMVYDLNGKKVVPNRRLRQYLTREVPKLAARLSIDIAQHPDSKVYSDEPTYISQVAQQVAAGPAEREPNVADVALTALWGERGPVSERFSNAQLQAVAAQTGFTSAKTAVGKDWTRHDSFQGRTGFVVVGAEVRRAAASRAGRMIQPPSSAANEGRVVVDVPDRRACSVAIQFSDGSGTILAALDGYIGHVLIDRGVVANVSYLPSREGAYWSAFRSQQQRLAELHGLVSAAARYGVLRFDGSRRERQRQAGDLANRIRMLKALDPTLGIYAASAYADAGLSSEVRSVRGIMRDTHGVDLLDVAMLTRDGSLRNIASEAVPCCPMLSQNWALLRAQGVQLPAPIAELKSNLAVSLWLTLDSQAIEQMHRLLPESPWR